MTKLHYFEDNAMNYIALETYTPETGSAYIMIDHDMSDEEVAAYVNGFESGEMFLEGCIPDAILSEEEFDAMTKLNHKIYNN